MAIERVKQFGAIESLATGIRATVGLKRTGRVQQDVVGKLVALLDQRISRAFSR